MTNLVKTTCPYCGVGCGVEVEKDDLGRISLRADQDHPANLGRLCSKGSALAETLDLEGRLLEPRINNKAVSWDTALDTVADRFGSIIDKHGPDAVAFYVSGQLLTEDYYVANKLMKGYIGSANIDTNSRLCMSSAVAGYKRAFGVDAVPCAYEDLERAKLIVLTGSNAAWCHPVLYQRMVKARKQNPDLQIILIDPRRTATADIADSHLALKPGTDAILFNGLLNYLDQAGESNPLFLQSVSGADEALETARNSSPDVETVAKLCDLEVGQVEAFYRLFARTERVITVFSQGINQSSSGTDKVNAIINCHLYSGRIGRPGMGPFSFTGQPNAMGGREVGGLANQLAAHLEIERPEHRELVQSFWNSPKIPDKPGYKAVELMDAIRQGKVKALWVMATNPAVSAPDSSLIRQALDTCDFLVVSDCMEKTDTTAHANVLLPATTWGEKQGTVTNSERRISRQRSFLSAPGDSRPDWWIMSEVAKRMGYGEGFQYQTEADIFREHAAMTAFRPEIPRDLDLGGLASISNADYESLEPIQWPVNAQHPKGTPRLFGDGTFYTQDGNARMMPITPRAPVMATSNDYPLTLNTGRVRDHWHTMTRTGKSPRLSGHIIEPYAEIHPSDAKRYHVHDKELVLVSGKKGSLVVRAKVSETQQAGSVFVPMHWNDQFAFGANINRAFPANTDPVSGQPEFKQNPVNIKRWQAGWYGFLLSRREVDLREATYWSKAKGKGLWRYEIAGEDSPQDWAHYSRSLLCTEANDVNWVEYFDVSTQRYRAARIVDGRLESCIFIGPDFELPSRDWLINIFDDEDLDDNVRRSLLTGKPGQGQTDAGRIICSCFGVGINTITEAILDQRLTSPEEIGEQLRAGTNCGSCIPELRTIIQQTLEPASA